MAVSITSIAPRYHSAASLTTYTFDPVDLSVFNEGDIIAIAIHGSDAVASLNVVSVSLNLTDNFTEIAQTNTLTSSIIPALYTLEAPSGLGAEEAIYVEFSGAMDRCTIALYRITGADGITAHDTFINPDPATNDDGTNPASGLINCPAGGGIISFVCTFDTNAISWTGLTEDFEEDRTIWISGASSEFESIQTGLSIQAAINGTPSFVSIVGASWSPAELASETPATLPSGAYKMIITPSDSFTRPANTTAYAAGDLVANNTTAGNVVPLTFSVAALGKGNGIIRRLRLYKDDETTTAAIFDVHLFSQAPTVTNGDNGVFAVDTSRYFLGTISVDMSSGAFATSGDLAKAVAVSPEIQFDLRSVNEAERRLYAFIETGSGGSYSPASGELFEVTLEIAGNS